MIAVVVLRTDPTYVFFFVLLLPGCHPRAPPLAHQLPMPQSESQFHAARIFLDTENRAVYDVEQWLDYIQLTRNYTYKPQAVAQSSSPVTRAKRMTGNNPRRATMN